MVMKAHGVAARAMKEARELSAKAVSRLAQLFPSGKIEADARPGSPYELLVTRAEQWGADLIVVGSHGRSAVGRMFFGSVSQKVLRYAPCSVRVSRESEFASGPVQIVVGVDASENAAIAVAAVAARNWPQDSQAKAVMALDTRLNTALPALVTEESTENSDAVLGIEKALETLRASGLLATGVAREGDPKKVLLEEARQWKADCIFVGARGLSRAQRFLLGSVSAAVAARADCSVEIIRARTQ